MPITTTTEQNENLLQFGFGILGAVIRLVFRYNKRMSFLQAFGTIIAGAACSYLIPPVIGNFLPHHSTQVAYLIGFGCGLTGMTLCEAVITVIDGNAARTLDKWVKKQTKEATRDEESDSEEKGDRHP